MFLNKELQNELSATKWIEREVETKKIFCHKVNFFITQLINYSIYFIGAYIVLSKEFSISTLIFSGILYSKLNSSSERIIISALSWTKCNNALKQLKGLFFNDNFAIDNVEHQNSEHLKGEKIIPMPKIIEIKNLNYHNGKKEIFKNLNLTLLPNTFISGASGTGKSTLYRLISGKLPEGIDSIYFDEHSISQLQGKSFNELLIYQNAKSQADEFNWHDLTHSLNSEVKEKIQELKESIGLKDNENLQDNELSDGQRQFINLLSLLNYSNKILLLDEASSHLNSELKEKVFKYLFSYLCEKNFVICSEHDLSVQKFFRHHIKLDELIK